VSGDEAGGGVCAAGVVGGLLGAQGVVAHLAHTHRLQDTQTLDLRLKVAAPASNTRILYSRYNVARLVVPALVIRGQGRI
jgi:hypothetical protein